MVSCLYDKYEKLLIFRAFEEVHFGEVYLKTFFLSDINSVNTLTVTGSRLSAASPGRVVRLGYFRFERDLGEI